MSKTNKKVAAWPFPVPSNTKSSKSVKKTFSLYRKCDDVFFMGGLLQTEAKRRMAQAVRNKKASLYMVEE